MNVEIDELSLHGYILVVNHINDLVYKIIETQMISLNSCYCTHSDKPLQCSIDKPEYSCCEEFLNLKDHIRM